MNKRNLEILKRMEREYGRDIACYLEHGTDWQLLFSTIMSAQCTDARVNEVAKVLYKKYPTLNDIASADPAEFEQDIKSVGYYRNKARNIIASAGVLLDRFNGKVPDNIEDLTSLPGVGRKTANVILSNIYRTPSIVVDTHVLRISNRLGFTTYKDPVKVEYDLMKKIDRDYWIYVNLWFIALGRSICMARSPKCGECYLKDICPYCKSSHS